MRAISIFLLCLNSTLLHAEYDSYIIRLRIISRTDVYPQYEQEGYVYAIKTPDANQSLKRWKEELCVNCEASAKAVLYSYRTTYSPKSAAEPNMEFMTHYQLHDTFNIDTSQIISVELLDVAWESSLSGIGSELTIEDTLWSNKPFVRHESIEIPTLMCDDCDDFLYQLYDIFIHEESDRINWVLDRIRGMEEMYLKRVEDIENWYGYNNKSAPEYVSLLKYYGPAVEEFLKLLEDEKVVFVVDSGW